MPIHVTRGPRPLSSDPHPSSFTMRTTQSATPRYRNRPVAPIPVFNPVPDVVATPVAAADAEGGGGAPWVMSRVFTTSIGVVTAPVSTPANAPKPAASCFLSSRPPDHDCHASFICSYDANSTASNGRSRRRKDPAPAKSPANTPSRAAMCHRAPRAVENCPVCTRVLITSVGIRMREDAKPPEAAAARCAPTELLPSAGNRWRLAGS
mmetsp:Transcript_11130/g.27164  ORF Transcript_11130/g.27164 Transcript_11130/m.27164 type:complete len:208 (-) Transcript_11130:347-970(-)